MATAARQSGCSVASRRSACHAQDRWPAAPSTSSAEKSAYARPHIDAGHTARTKVMSDRTKVACRPRIAGAFAVSARQDHKQGGHGEKGHAMTHGDNLPAEVRKQDEEAELQVAAQLAEL